jgi:16S rRNA (cytosine967-C5)-methyltransferase
VISSAKKTGRTVRELASEILFKVDRNKAYADVLLDHALRSNHLDDRDRALLTELVYGTLRWRGAVDARLSHHLHRPLSEAQPWARNLLRLAAYQLVYLDRIPDYAAVNEAVDLAKHRGGPNTAAFVNGVLRNFLRETAEDISITTEPTLASLAVQCSHPEWLVRRWVGEFNRDEATALMRANNEHAPLGLRANALKCTRDELLARLLGAGVDAKATPWSPDGISLQAAGSVENLPGFADGWFQVQGEASQLVCYLLAPLSGERILDACAAPGGKSTHIAELTKDHGEIVAIDSSARGIEKIRQNVGRLGLRSVRATRANAGVKLGKITDGIYDRVLLDAPCSGLGTLRAHPEIKWQRDERDIQRLSDLQAKLLENVAAHLKSGGILVYSTCTLTRDENEQNVESFLARHPEFELQEAARYLPERARELVRGKYFTTLPQHHGIDGFFAARMRKV